VVYIYRGKRRRVGLHALALTGVFIIFGYGYCYVMVSSYYFQSLGVGRIGLVYYELLFRDHFGLPYLDRVEERNNMHYTQIYNKSNQTDE
jgi:hypothetical protein